ncbi:hypothetical protein E4T66_19280 [Sinimarinibacterium sp. CAU 1509]|uniref:pilus assembly protein TadG-related protein n=1 Tax=Sinimarinibacterium sp. CAU 1509 TaxID=2562283 RepID=UPI0010AC619F|nr:pilus assembly protein TadG-related protein [Sinimarinibacterium sp. CAU 1509]TJY56704.1 hypothetical protein E4T66_19280 [Sinimarinibacterium sp. CAU 1509]
MRRWRARQRGAAAIFAAIAAGACLIAVALVIDIGRLYSAQRDLQRMANLSALDAARIAGGCMGVPGNPQGAAFSEVSDSIVRNGARKGVITVDSVLLGRQYDSPDGVRRFVITEPGKINEAVRVELSRPVPRALLPFARAGGGTLRASAAAYSRPSASVKIGTRLAEVDPDFLNKFLSAALGGPVKLDAVGYASLIDAKLPLDELIDQLDDAGQGNVLFERISIHGLLHATADALSASGQSVASATAQQMADVATTSATVVPAELVSLERDLSAAVGSSLIDVGELTLATAQVATQSSAVRFAYALPPPLGDSDILIRVLQAAQQGPAIAPALPGEDAEPEYVSNAQGLVQTNLSVSFAPLGVTAKLPLWFELAQGTAEVTNIECAREGVAYDRVAVLARTSLSRLGIGEFDDINAPEPKVRPAALVDADFSAGLLGIPLPVHVRITALALHAVTSGQDALVFQSPFEDPQTAGGSLELADAIAQLPGAVDLNVEITPLGSNALPLLSGVVDPTLDAALASAKSAIEAALRNRLAELTLPMADALSRNILSGAGLSVGNADVWVFGVNVTEPYLFTH